MNIIEYINKYKEYTFEEKEFNEVDNIVLSILSYLNFDEPIKNINLEYVGKNFLKEHTYKEIASLGLPQKDAYNCLKEVIESKRYKNIEILDYIYLGTQDEQFSAITFKIKKDLNYITFEGTDNLMSGWKEDFQLSYMYPVSSQIHAIKYLDKNIKYFGPKVIVGGHSKGGNLALVSSMEMNRLKQNKIIKIYNNDGPGLRRREFDSKRYENIKSKYVHIVPYNSFIGVMLRNSNYKVIKSNRKTILSHYPISWIVEENSFEEANLKQKSKDLEKSVIEWLDNHNDFERKIMIDNVFKIFETCEITDTRNLKKIKYIIKVIKEVRNIDEQTKDLAISFIKHNFFNKNLKN